MSLRGGIKDDGKIPMFGSPTNLRTMRAIKNGELRLGDVPTKRTEEGVIEFALSFDPIEYWGSIEAAFFVANNRQDKTLAEARTRLFIETRRARNDGYSPQNSAILSSIKRIEELLRTDDPSCKEDFATVRQQLHWFYCGLVSDWRRLLPDATGLSAPLLPFPSEEYLRSERRLLVVGKETSGWVAYWEQCRKKEISDLVSELTSFASEWYRRADHRTPFFRALDQLARKYVPTKDPRQGCLWANVVPFDENKGMISEEVGVALGRVSGLLPTLIHFIKPTAIVLLSGHNYDAILKHQFRDHGLEFEPMDPNGQTLSRLSSPILPLHTYRTYHPAYLQHSGQWAVLDSISKLLQSS